jgi:hypothetical protein
MQGKILLHPKLELLNQGTISIDTNSLVKGVYFLDVATDNGNQKIKFIKK